MEPIKVKCISNSWCADRLTEGTAYIAVAEAGETKEYYVIERDDTGASGRFFKERFELVPKGKPTMTEREYARAIKRTVQHYERIRKQYVREQMPGNMLVSLQHEKNERLARFAAMRYGEQQ
jgi:GH24 family phage-related lysozyme (muramidase)